ncbi:MAG: hypothetical protein H0V79_11475 [Actinobacteria bacterium]|nr:hypothetical protein [Actinomycetota bacterium]
MARLTFGELLFVLALASVAAMAVFAHAEKRQSKHATAWGVAAFLAAGVVVPVYFIRHWLKTRRQQ